MAIQQGWSQMTAAARNIIGSGLRGAVRGAVGRRTRRKKKARAVGRRTKRARGGRKSSMVAGSAAAKAWGKRMKKLRKK